MLYCIRLKEGSWGWSCSGGNAVAKEESMGCKDCKFWEEDKQYRGMGDCKNEKITDFVIAGYAEYLLFSNDFGCKLFEVSPKPTV